MKKNFICLSLISCCFLLFPQVSPRANENYDLENYGVFKPYKMIVFENSVYLLDKHDYKITKIVSGKKIIRFGQTGQGPNEYTIPIGFIMDNRKIHIYNIDGKKISFNLNGEWLETMKTKGGSVFSSDIILRKIGDKKFIARKMKFDDSGDSYIYFYYQNGNHEEQLVRVSLSFDQLRSGQTRLQDIESILFAIGGKYCFYTEDKTHFKVSAFCLKEEKKQSWIEMKDYERQKYSKEEIESNELEKRESLREAPPMLKEILRKQTLPKYKPAIHNFIADEKDRLYVITNESKDGCRFVRVYDELSRFTKSLWLPDYICIQAYGGRVYLVVEEQDTYKLKIFTIF